MLYTGLQLADLGFDCFNVCITDGGYVRPIHLGNVSLNQQFRLSRDLAGRHLLVGAGFKRYPGYLHHCVITINERS